MNQENGTDRRQVLRLSLGTLMVTQAGRSLAAPGGSALHEGFVPVGGIDQWISVRGESRDAPVLLFLHGGPGEALSPFLAQLAPWTRALTVAFWDQRGAGKTYGRNRAAPGEMSLARLTADTIQLAEYLRAWLGKEKIVLAGQSWGSLLAWNSIRLRPDLFHAYVGTGQTVNWARAVAVQEAAARAKAQAAGDREAIASIDAVSKLPPEDFRRTQSLKRWIMPPSDQAFLSLQRRFAGDPPFPEAGEIGDWVRGFGLSAEALTPAVLAFDAYKPQPAAGVPVVMIQGRDDLVTPTELVEKFVRDLNAPSKAMIKIDGGHFACYTNADTFADALTGYVRPLGAN